MMIILMFYFWVEDPTAYEHDDLFCRLERKPIVDDIYVYICFVLGMDPEAHD